MATSSPTVRPSARTGARRSAVQWCAFGFGLAFLLVGIAGFVPGLTAHVDRIRWFGHDSPSELLGVFRVSVLHNAVHLLLGIAGLVLARTPGSARTYLIFSGILYAALVVFGTVVGEHSAGNFVPVNDADDWLHLVLAVVMVLAGLGAPGPDVRLEDRTAGTERR